MALPTTLTDYVWPLRPQFVGPFRAQGAWWIVGVRFNDPFYQPAVWRNTDPEGTNWGTFYSSATGGSSAIHDSLSVVQQGDLLRITTHNGATLAYFVYDTKDEVWDDAGSTIESIADAPGVGGFCSIAMRSDGDVIIGYQGDSDREMGSAYERVDYARWEGSWTVGISLDNSDAGGAEDDKHYTGAVVVKGSSDRMHFFLADRSFTNLHQRTVTSVNARESWPSPGDSNLDIDFSFSPGISYDDSGTQRVRCPYRDATTAKISYAEFDSVDSPGTFTKNGDVSQENVWYFNENPVACMAVDGVDEYLLYAGLDQDLYQDKNDTADTEVLDGTTINRISCAVLDRDGPKLAYVYDNGGTTYYNEVDIAPTVSTLSAAEFPLRNYYTGPFKT